MSKISFKDITVLMYYTSSRCFLGGSRDGFLVTKKTIHLLRMNRGRDDDVS